MKDDIFLDNKRVCNRRFNMKLNRRDLLHMIFDTFPVLVQAYELKEEYRQLNHEGTYEEACEKLPLLAVKFKNSRINQFNEFTAIPFNWLEEILNSFRRPYGDRKLSNSFAENINGRIRTYLSVSNGVNNFEKFRKRVIYALSSDIYYALTPTLKSDKRNKKKRGSYNKI